MPMFYVSLTSFTGVSGRERCVLSPVTESRIMFSQSVVAHAEMPLNERVEDRSTVPAENGAAVTIEELRTHHCRWPLGAVHAKPPFLYCGERALAGKPYCDEHCARAFQVRREASAPGIRVSASRIPNQASTPRTEERPSNGEG